MYFRESETKNTVSVLHHVCIYVYRQVSCSSSFQQHVHFVTLGLFIHRCPSILLFHFKDMTDPLQPLYLNEGSNTKVLINSLLFLPCHITSSICMTYYKIFLSNLFQNCSTTYKLPSHINFTAIWHDQSN